MLKGHTTIELTDVNTGEVEIIEEDNIITDALQDMFTPKGVKAFRIANKMRTSDIAAYNSSDISKYFEGIYLFEDTVDSDEHNSNFFEINNSITGAGSARVSELSQNPCMGVYNPTASEITKDQLKLVWEFNTTQANGRISSVCLVPEIAGCFFPTDSPDKLPFFNRKITHSNLMNIQLYEAITTTTTSTKKSSYPLYLDGDYLYCLDTNNAKSNTAKSQTTIKIHKFNFNLKRIITSGYPLTPSDIDCVEENSSILETITINMPQEFITYLGSVASNPCLFVSYSNGFIYYSANTSSSSSINSKQSVKILKINVKTNETSVITFTNNLDIGIYFHSYRLVDPGNVASEILGYPNAYIEDNKLITKDTSSSNPKLYIIDLSNNLNYEVIDLSAYGVIVSSIKHLRFKDTLYFSGYLKDGSKTLVVPFTYNLKTRKLNLYQDGIEADTGARDGNLDNIIKRDAYVGIPLTPEFEEYMKGNIAISWERTYYSYSSVESGRLDFYVHYNPYRLVTINNLASAVTKTASQTMRVTYSVVSQT